MNINSKKGAGLINFYLASNSIIYLLLCPRSNVRYSQGTRINTEVDFPDQTSLGPKVLNLTVLFQLCVNSAFLLTCRHYLLLFVSKVSLFFFTAILTKPCSKTYKAQRESWKGDNGLVRVNQNIWQTAVGKILSRLLRCNILDSLFFLPKKGYKTQC